MTDYHFVSTSELDAPIDQVRAALEAIHAGPGMSLVVRTPLRLRVDLRAAGQGQVAPRTLLTRVGGDLAGVATWALAQQGAATTLSWTWDVRAVRGWARLLGPLARPLVRRGHERAGRRLGADLAARLGAHASLT